MVREIVLGGATDADADADADADGDADGVDGEAPAPDTPEALFDEVAPQPDGSLSVVCDGRRLKLSNWDKVLFPAAASPRAI